MKKLLLTLFIFFVIFLPNRSNAFSTYSIIDIGTIAGSETTASAINNNGVVVGSIGWQEGAFKWEDGQAIILPQFPDNPETGALSINNKNEIVGFSTQGNWPDAAMWDSDNNISSLFGAGFARDINESSQIVIESWGSYESFLWGDGSLQVIASTDLNGIDHSGPNAINENGQVVGWGYAFGEEDGNQFAYLWEDDNLYDLNDLVTDGYSGILDEAIDINDSGQIVGDSWLFENGNVVELGFSASSINEIGQIAGSNYLYENGQLYDLNEYIESDISYSDLLVSDINDLGQMVGSFYVGDETHAFLMNPIPFTVTFSSAGNGSITGETVQIIDHGGSCAEVTAVPSTGYHFTGWTGDYTGENEDLTISNVTFDMNITANFEINIYTITFSPGDHGGLSGVLNQSIEHGGISAQITAYPTNGYYFVNWNGAPAEYESDNPLIIENVTSNMNITANYVLSYDGNNDGIPDALQDHVKTLTTENNQSITLEFSEATDIISYGLVDNPSPDDTPAGIAFPFGFLRFTIDNVEIGGATTVTIYLPEGTVLDTYYKYGSTLDSINPHWYEFLYDNTTGAEINGSIITLHFLDGERGDDDLITNGIIVDDGGPGISLSTPPDTSDDDIMPDSAQDNVDSIQTDGSNESIILVSPPGTTLSNCQAIDNPSPTDAPTDIDLPYGMFGFTIDGVVSGGSTTITIILPAGANPASYYKYGPTPEDPSNHWYEFMYDGETGAVINENAITLYFVDGKRGDSDLDATNGTIVDPGGPSIIDALNIPDSASGDGGGGGCFIGSLTK